MGILHCRCNIPREFPTGITHPPLRHGRMKHTWNGVSVEGTGLRQDATAVRTPVKARSNEASERNFLSLLAERNIQFGTVILRNLK
jgi:hypothetical protein